MNTVKVRIAVQVDPEGNWDAGGDSANSSTDWADQSNAWDLEGAKRYWVEAELPIPEAAAPEVIAGNAIELEETAAPAAEKAA